MGQASLDRWLWVRESEVPEWALQALTLQVGKGHRGDQVSAVPFYCRHVANGQAYVGLPRQWGLYNAKRLGLQVERPDLSKVYDLAAPQLFYDRLDPDKWALQGPLVDSAVSALRNDLGGIVVAECGFGKTIVGVAVGCALGVPTLVLVGGASGDLADQWERTALDFCGEVAGRIQESRREVRPITVATVQTLAARGLDPALAGSWGLVIVDECHHLPAETWLRALHLVNAPYRLGLTATLRRADGAVDACSWFLGRTVAEGKGLSMKGRAVLSLSPGKVSYGGCLEWERGVGGTSRPKLSKWGAKPMLNYTKLVRALTTNEAHNAWVLDLAAEAVSRGRQVLVLAGKVEHVTGLAKMLHKRIPGSAGVYVGKAKSRTLGIPESERPGQLLYPVTFCTYGAGREALDIPHKDTLIFATPPGDPEQAAGRVRRFREGKATPMVFDVVPPHVRAVEGAVRRAEVYGRPVEADGLGFEVFGAREVAQLADHLRRIEVAYLGSRERTV